VAIDGEPAGKAPLVADVLPGTHSVRLTLDGKSTDFQLAATTDPAEWCFEGKGGTFKNIRCP
jgi:hypothetical protein